MSSEKFIFKYDCINNDEKLMTAMISPFRPKSVNPIGYQHKLEFWKKIIAEFCSQKGSSTFTLEELQIQLKWKNISPYGLKEVIGDMLEQKEVRTKADFAQNLSKGVFAWTFGGITSSLNRAYAYFWPEAENTFVHIDIVKKQSDLLMDILQRDYPSKVITIKQLLDKSKINLNREGMAIALDVLHSERKIFVERIKENNGNEIVLIKVPAKETLTQPITDQERSLHMLHLTESTILEKLESIEAEIKICDKKTRDYLKQNERMKAKVYLRKKHLLDKSIEKYSASLGNIQALIENIYDTENHKPILEAYKIGSQTLKSLLGNPELSVNKIDDVMLSFRECLEDNQEIQQSIQNIAPSTIYEESDESLDQELQDLLANDQPKLTDTNSDNLETTNTANDNIPNEILDQLNELSLIVPQNLNSSESVNPPTEGNHCST